MKPTRFLPEWTGLFVVGCALFFLSGAARAQRPMGTDVSSYQGGSLNWSTLKSDGLSFAWTKATEGTYYEDADFAINEQNAPAAGIPIGAYHFARPHDDPNITGGSSADSEASYFWSFAGGYITTGGHSLVPMLDWEDPGITNNASLTASVLSQWLNEWCNAVSNDVYSARSVAIQPVVYTGTWYSEPGGYAGLNSTVTGWPTWVAAYPSCTGSACGDPSPQTDSPSPAYPWFQWEIWQYGDTNWSGGDSDVFNGASAQFLQQFLISSNFIQPGASVYWDPGASKVSPGSGGTGTWDGVTSNWYFHGGSDTVWACNGANATFAGTAGTVTPGSQQNIRALTFNTTGYTIAGSQTLLMTYAGAINVPTGISATISCVMGGAAFNLTGGGTLTLNNANNWSDGETVTGPNTTLIVPTDHPLGNDGVTLNLVSGGIYQVNDSTSGDEFLLPGCAVALGSGGGIFKNPNGNLTMSNFITGSGSLTIAGGSYTLTLTDTGNNYTGGTIVQSGTLKANAAGVLGSTSGALTVNGGTLNLNSASFTAGAVTITGGTISTGTLTGASYAGQAGTISAALAGSGSLTKTTTGTLTLSGANTYTGTTTISGGLLQISSDANLGTAPTSPVANKLVLSGGISNGLRCTATFTLNANRGITLTGPSGGSLHATSGQTLTYGGIIAGSGNLGIGASDTLGYGVTLLSGASTYTGSTTIAAGTLRLGANGALPSGTPLIIGADGNSGGGGVFDLNGYSQTIGPLSSSAGILGTGTDTPTIKLTGALTIRQTNSAAFAGAIIGSGGSLTLTGNSELSLTGTNTYTGATILSSGALGLSGNGSINNTASLSIAAGATFDLSALSSYTFGGGTALYASGNATPAVINSGGTVSLGSNPIILTYDGAHPALSISQGTLVLNGNAFTVNGPALAGGVYTIVQQSTGSITASGSFPVSGTALANATGVISIAGGSVILTVTDNTATALGTMSPSTYFQPVTFTATVSPTPPAGTVQFYDNGSALGAPIAITNGSASYSVTNLAAGSHPINATYSGATYYYGSTSVTSNQQVNPAPATVTAVAQSKQYGTTLAFGPGSTNFTSAGLQNGDTIGSVTLSVNNNGGASNAPVGNYTITPSAAAGGSFNPSNYTITYNAGTLTVTLPPNTIPVTITGISLNPDGTVQLTFAGTPGYVYYIEAATNLTPPIPWVILGTNAADSSGNFDFTDTQSTNYGARFYQTQAESN